MLSANNPLEQARLKLEVALSELTQHKIALAFSGGVDSSLLLVLLGLRLKQGQLPHGLVAFTVSTTMHPQHELKEAQDLAKSFNIELEVLKLDELPVIAHNPVNRCYLCKHALMTKLKERAAELGCSVVIDGTNADDLTKYRPGLQALKELGIKSPLAQAGITKEQVRGMLAQLGLNIARKPSSPCLATRFPYGTELKPEAMAAVGQAEERIRALGFTNVRVRAYPEARLIRLELDAEALSRAVEYRSLILPILQSMKGYDHYTLDLKGFASGSMDKAILAQTAIVAQTK